MVGVYLAPNGKETKQVEVLCNKTKEWAYYIRHSPLDEEAVWIALKHLIQSVEYPLAAMNLKAAELGYAMAPALMEALPRANIVRTMPRVVLYGPYQRKDSGLQTHMYTSTADTSKT